MDQISVMGVHLEAGAPHVVFRTRTGRRRGRVAAVSALKSSIQFRNVGVYRHHSCQERRRSVKITSLGQVRAATQLGTRWETTAGYGGFERRGFELRCCMDLHGNLQYRSARMTLDQICITRAHGGARQLSSARHQLHPLTVRILTEVWAPVFSVGCSAARTHMGFAHAQPTQPCTNRANGRPLEDTRYSHPLFVTITLVNIWSKHQ